MRGSYARYSVLDELEANLTDNTFLESEFFMQQQEQAQKTPPNYRQRLQVALQFVWAMRIVIKQDSVALKMESVLVESLERLRIVEQDIQTFREHIAKIRQRLDHIRLVDIYIMGGILIYCGILFPTLIGLGVSDLALQITWVTFAMGLSVWN